MLAGMEGRTDQRTLDFRPVDSSAIGITVATALMVTRMRTSVLMRGSESVATRSARATWNGAGGPGSVSGAASALWVTTLSRNLTQSDDR